MAAICKCNQCSPAPKNQIALQIERLNSFARTARHIAAYEYSHPYAEFDVRDAATMAARIGRAILEATEHGVIYDPIIEKIREGAASECGYGEHYIAPQPCGEVAKEIQRAERAQSRNCLRVDYVETGAARCCLKAPANINPARWLLSGGSPYVFGICSGRLSVRCPKNAGAAHV